MRQYRAKPFKGTCNDYSERKYTQVSGNGSYLERGKEIVYSTW
nr:MAG TPA: hypothetical protein [Caudoviricetes sp.]